MASAAPAKRVLIVITEDHYDRSPAGTFTINLNYDYWKQYLELFDEVRPLARVRVVAEPTPGWQRADGPGVRFAELDFYQGLGSMLRAMPRTLRTMHGHLREGGYFAMRGAGGVCSLATLWLAYHRIPYGRQVVGHALEGIQMGADVRSHRLRSALARLGFRIAQWEVSGACTAAYVSDYLRQLYPPARGAPTFLFSDVNLDSSVITKARAPESFNADPLRLISVGRLNPEKGFGVLLDALSRLDQSGESRWQLEVIGTGPELDTLKRRAADCGIADRATFSGWVAWGPELFARLDRADVYVLPSLTEGTPRALIEAQARGLPALGTNVGGVPPLMNAAHLMPAGDAGAMADRIRSLIGARETLAAMSRDSFERALRFHPDVMNAQKRAYWTYLRDYTDRWRRMTGT